MTVTWSYSDYWATYKSNPEMLEDDVEKLLELVVTKSTKVQLEMIRDAPQEILDRIRCNLTLDCQWQLLSK